MRVVLVDSIEIDGWLVGLVRTSSEWTGNQYLSAKAEFYSLLLKMLSNEPYLDLTIVTDIYTAKRFYTRWIEELDVPNVNFKKFSVCIVDVPNETNELIGLVDESEHPILNNKTQWREEFRLSADKFIEKLYKNRTDLVQSFPPDWIYQYVVSPEDLVVGIEKNKVEGMV